MQAHSGVLYADVNAECHRYGVKCTWAGQLRVVLRACVDVCAVFVSMHAAHTTCAQLSPLCAVFRSTYILYMHATAVTAAALLLANSSSCHMTSQLQ
jgi:hypothetical protein